MTDQTADSLDMIKQDGSTGAHPKLVPQASIVRTEDGIVTEGSKLNGIRRPLLGSAQPLGRVLYFSLPLCWSTNGAGYYRYGH